MTTELVKYRPMKMKTKSYELCKSGGKAIRNRNILKYFTFLLHTSVLMQSLLKFDKVLTFQTCIITNKYMKIPKRRN